MNERFEKLAAKLCRTQTVQAIRRRKTNQPRKMNDTHENLNEGSNGGSPGMTCSPSSIVAFIRRYNRWRQGEEDWTELHPRDVGEILDAVCDTVEEMEIRHAAAMLHTQAIVDESNTLRAKYAMHHTEAESITRDNIRLKCTLAKWHEWARMHGHLEHAAGIADDTREILSENDLGDGSPDTNTQLTR